MFIFAFLALFSTSSFALEAVISVLEAPLFRKKDINSQVIQYKRKGDIIKIHPVLNDDFRYDHLRDKKTFLKEKFAYNEDEFIPTYDRFGNLSYVLRDHIFIYFEDEREHAQIPLKKDPTDYRLQEPLPETYPLYQKTGYRGQFFFAVSEAYKESYPYAQDAKGKGYSLPMSATLNLMRRAKHDVQDRLYFGLSLSFTHHETSFVLTNNNQVSERANKFGLGPIISYDAYKSNSARISIMTGVLVNLFHQFDITQTDRSNNSESRAYRGYSFTPKLSAHYSLSDVLPKVDFVLGTEISADLAGNLKVDRGSRYETWWQNPGTDSFRPKTNINSSIYLGLQSRI